MTTINSFNSQPPEGGWYCPLICICVKCRFNSQPPEGGWVPATVTKQHPLLFQLTAARRRLVPPLKPLARKACIALFC